MAKDWVDVPVLVRSLMRSLKLPRHEVEARLAKLVSTGEVDVYDEVGNVLPKEQAEALFRVKH